MFVVEGHKAVDFFFLDHCRLSKDDLMTAAIFKASEGEQRIGNKHPGSQTHQCQ